MVRVNGELVKTGYSLSKRRGIVRTKKSHYSFNYYFRDENGKEIQYNESEFKHTAGNIKLERKFNKWVKEISKDFENAKYKEKQKEKELDKKKTKETIFKNFVDSQQFKDEVLKSFENSTFKNAKYMWKKLARENTAMAEKQLSEITVAECAEALNKILYSTSANNAKKYKFNLQKVFEVAENLGYIEQGSNPVKPYRLPRENSKKANQKTNNKKGKQYILDVNEEKAVLENLERLDIIYQYFYRFILLTGLRSGEAQAVEWTDIDWDGRKISIHQTFTEEIDSPQVSLKEYTKTGEGEDNPRIIPLWNNLSELLKKWFVIQNNGMAKNGVDRQHIEHDYIFRRFDGQLYSVGRWGDVWYEFREKLLKEGIISKPTTLHNLRGTYLSRLLNNKEVPISIVQKIAGHSKIEMTLDYYNQTSDFDVISLVDRHYK